MDANDGRPDSLSDQRFVLEALRLLVTLPGYLRPDARTNDLWGWTLRDVDKLLDPEFGSPLNAHREVLELVAKAREIA